MTPAQRTALEQLQMRMGGSLRTPERWIREVGTILEMPEPDHTALIKRLTSACARYDDWYQHGSQSHDHLSNLAYDLVSHVRQAIAALRGEGE